MSDKLKSIELEKAYNPKSFEDRIYALWLENECFKPVKKDGAKTFTMVMPPPNVTGVLHIGHGLDNTLQDIAVRYRRMKGEETLWVPGTDHAGIATQHVVEKLLKKEGKSKRSMSRGEFVERTFSVKDEHHKIIKKQLCKLGASADWSRERFTLDEGLSKAVREVFVSLYEEGLIYQGEYLVNWCPSCGTALADDEVEHEDKNGFMYHIFYELADGTKTKSGENIIEIATTRPETLLGDTAVAVHPEDERYKNLIGKEVILPLVNKKIPIIADTYVDKEFGTGVVKITPAHDPNDWEMGKRQNLPVLNILNPDGTLNKNVPEKYRGLKCAEARKIILEDLEAAGLFKEAEKIKHAVGCCYRCSNTVEPYLSKQWFVKMKPLAEKALAAWKSGEIKFYPQKYENTYARWMENIRDWCISRQLWWGHRIPVWYCADCGETAVSRQDICACPKCKSKNITQDPDVLDTWFSSWLWPFSTLGWPEKTEDLARYYPTTALVTGYDIIFFWVARMIMAGLHFTGKVPFTDIYLHGLIRDKQGRKMSKSLGNGIDPLAVIDEYGADALKFTLAFICAQGQDMPIDMDAFKLGSKFANKVWNASRYILSNLEGRKIAAVQNEDLKKIDKWIFHSLNETAAAVRKALESYKYNEAAQLLYEFFWNDFCDWYVEGAKLSFKYGDEEEKDRAVSVLLSVMEKSLRLLHPFLSFVTEEIYSKLPAVCAEGANARSKILTTAPYPEYDPLKVNAEAAECFASMQEIVRSVRALRTECGIDPALKLNLSLFTENGSPAQSARENAEIIKMLAGLNSVTFIQSTAEKPAGSMGTVGAGFEAFIETKGSVDLNQLKTRFEKELEKNSALVKMLGGKLKNKNFTENAPAEVVEGERQKLFEAERRCEKLKAYIAEIEKA